MTSILEHIAKVAAVVVLFFFVLFSSIIWRNALHGEATATKECEAKGGALIHSYCVKVIE